MSLEEAEKEKEKEKEKEERDASTRIITQITLDCLLNKEQYSKYLNATMSKTMESSKRDRKFYKRRILQMTKDLLLSEEIDTPSDMLFAFDQFARSCISYFKMIDKTDILQTDYPPLDEPLINAGELTPFKDSAESLMRSVKINAITMDKFVKRISTAPVKAPVIPQMRDINLKDPELRNKGIRKKKNVDTLYAEKNNEEKETESI
jgi:hypothetical protein